MQRLLFYSLSPWNAYYLYFFLHERLLFYTLSSLERLLFHKVYFWKYMEKTLIFEVILHHQVEPMADHLQL